MNVRINLEKDNEKKIIRNSIFYCFDRVDVLVKKGKRKQQINLYFREYLLIVIISQ